MNCDDQDEKAHRNNFEGRSSWRAGIYSGHRQLRNLRHVVAVLCYIASVLDQLFRVTSAAGERQSLARAERARSTSTAKWKRSSSLSTVMSNGVVVVPSSFVAPHVENWSDLYGGKVRRVNQPRIAVKCEHHRLVGCENRIEFTVREDRADVPWRVSAPDTPALLNCEVNNFSGRGGKNPPNQ